ncbi:MAG: efflux transporter outer membrane subunit [Desulfococcaceae bacterium]|jgi:NodT family efflux transporter outer membrane factor (OMF) lipoprotein|nr:efflux transporter outer membrane subunit [Desulfococcaceae bacterium]
MKYKNIYAVFFSLLLFFSCTFFDPVLRENPEGEMPGHFSLTSGEGEIPEQWWKSFEDKQLDQLIREALKGNFNLQEAWARLRQVKAVAVQAGASAYPDLYLDGDTSYGRQRSKGDAGTSARTVENYSLGLLSSYELDLWGKIRSEREAAALAVSASQEDMYAAAMTIAAAVAERWTEIISRGMQRRLLEKQLQTNRTYLELVELRFFKGMVSALDVYQQKQVVEEIRSKIPLVEAQEQLLRHELALLLGKTARYPLEISRRDLPEPGKIPAIGLPADLLSMRPDIRAAGFRLQAADWDTAAARADRLPNIRLSATALYGADELDLIFDNWLLRLVGSLSAPLFDGKRRSAEVERRRAIADEKLMSYRRIVYTALKEAEDALISEEKQRQHIRALELQMDAARKALNHARERYRKGLSDYLPVLTQILSVQNLERNMLERRSELLIDRISLYRALGGTWMKDTGEKKGDMKNER